MADLKLDWALWSKHVICNQLSNNSLQCWHPRGPSFLKGIFNCLYFWTSLFSFFPYKVKLLTFNMSRWSFGRQRLCHFLVGFFSSSTLHNRNVLPFPFFVPFPFKWSHPFHLKEPTFSVAENVTKTPYWRHSLSYSEQSPQVKSYVYLYQCRTQEEILFSPLLLNQIIQKDFAQDFCTPLAV